MVLTALMTTLAATFSNRELATLTWLGVLLAHCLWHPPIRRALGKVVAAFCHPLILTALGIATFYIGFCVWVMAERGVWTTGQLKTTIIWAITFAFVTMFDVGRITEDKTFFGKTIHETIGVTALLLFIVELYSFAYWIELIAIPVVTSLQLGLAVAENDEKLANLRGPVGWLLAIVGFGLFGISAYKTVADPAAIMTLDTLREFLVPVVLSALFLPFIYLFGVYAAYERSFATLVITMPNRGLRRYAKRRALMRFRTDLDYLKRWQRAVQIERPADRAGVDAIIDELSAVAEREADPPSVPTSKGWAPNDAIRFLADHDLPTGDYHRSFEEEWFASATLFGLGDDRFNPNNLGFYVSGTANVASTLKLKLYVNQPPKAVDAERQFGARGLILTEAALGPGTREQLEDSMSALQPFSIALPNGHVTLAREDWVGGIKGGYDWTLTLSRSPALTPDD